MAGGGRSESPMTSGVMVVDGGKDDAMRKMQQEVCSERRRRHARNRKPRSEECVNPNENLRGRRRVCVPVCV